MVVRIANARRSIGVLDLQGGVQEHLDHLQRCAVPSCAVKRTADLEALAGLIIPGGESSTIGRLLDRSGLKEAILRGWQRGLKLWGTCAGAILLARPSDKTVPSLDLMDMDIERNTFGSQLDSFNSEALIQAVASYPIPLTFIRAPKIIHTGPEVKMLLKINDYIAAAEDGNCLATVFHPELTHDLAFHRYFARKCGLLVRDKETAAGEGVWSPTSWMHVAR